MNKIERDFEFSVIIDSKIIHEFTEIIDEDNLIENAKLIEKILIENGTKPEKIKNVFEIIVEVMLNVLNYSYPSMDLGNNKRQGYGSFSLSYNSQCDIFILNSRNLINISQKSTIQSRIDEIQGLDNQELRKLIREKMRNRKDVHSKGTGLGFASIAKRCSYPIEVSFDSLSDELILYKQKIII